MRKIWMVACAIAGALPIFGQSSICDAVTGNLVQNCGFESFAAGPLGNWTVTKPNGANSHLSLYVGGSPQVNSGSESAEFYGTGPLDDSLSQALATTNGLTYSFTFWLHEYSSGTTTGGDNFQVSWDGANVLNLSTSTSGFAYTSYTFQETGTGSDTIKFAGQDHSGQWYLDDVIVTNTASTPETSSILMLGTVLLGLSVGLRVRSRVRSRGPVA
jgi:hypothetical protein